MSNKIIWRTFLRKEPPTKSEKGIFIQWRKYKDGNNVLVSNNMEPKSDIEKKFANLLAKDRGFDWNGTEFFIQIKKSISLEEFQIKVDCMYRMIEDYKENKKTGELVSFRLPKWIEDELRKVKGNDIDFPEVVKDALMLWSKNQREKEKNE